MDVVTIGSRLPSFALEGCQLWQVAVTDGGNPAHPGRRIAETNTIHTHDEH
ncbi:hypothetical protein ACGFZK_06075 [Streptomyces sp. NPDC048257]|uniref:hypothetical protein n=1 Tax=Streptomyces sp. NPDC048257 TaxID=3365526 RepID=UPI00371036BE